MNGKSVLHFQLLFFYDNNSNDDVCARSDLEEGDEMKLKKSQKPPLERTKVHHINHTLCDQPLFGSHFFLSIEPKV